MQNNFNPIKPNSLYVYIDKPEFTSVSCPWEETGGVISSIYANTTTDEFEHVREKFPEYKLEDCFRIDSEITRNAICQAAFVRNVNLIKYLCKVGGEHLLNLHAQGTTPLLITAHDEDGITRELIQLGVNVNEINSSYFFVRALGHPIFRYTVLDYLLMSDTENKVSTIQLLVLNGGRVLHSLENNHMAIEKLNKAMRPIYVRLKCLFEGIKDDGSMLYSLPADIIRSVIDSSRLLKWIDDSQS